MKNRIIKFQEPYNSPLVKKYVLESLNSNYYSTGSFESRAKQVLKEKFNINNSLVTHSATGALELIAIYLSKNFRKSIVHLPSYTFSSTANAFLRSGFKLNFLDVELNDLMINLKNYSTFRKNDIVVPVHYSGHSVNFDNINMLNNNFIIVEDAAQGLGSLWKNKQLGTIGKFGAISFHHTKNVQSGFGGLAISQFKEPMERLKYIYERGTDRNKVISGLKNKYEWVELGSSFQIPDILSAILVAQLENYEKIISKRLEITKFYNSLFSSIDSEFISLPNFSNYSHTNYHAYFIIFKTNKIAKEFLDFTYLNGISCYIGYVPLHNSKMGKKLNLNKKLTNTEFIHRKIVRLPIHTELSEKDLKYIEYVFRKFFTKLTA